MNSIVRDKVRQRQRWLEFDEGFCGRIVRYLKEKKKKERIQNWVRV